MWKPIHPPPAQDFYIIIDEKAPMRDGVNLSTDIYIPEGPGPFPVLLSRTHIDNQKEQDINWAWHFVKHDYAVVLQDCRGRHDSEGEWEPYVNEANDGYDTQQWIGAQEWCDGNIGMFGISYVGFTQILTAPLRSPYLKAIMPIGAQRDNKGCIYQDSILQLQTAMMFFRISGRTVHTGTRSLIDDDRLLRRLPLITAMDDLVGGEGADHYREFIRRYTYDEYWKSYSMRHKYDQVAVSAYFVTGWYDNLMNDTFRNFEGWRTKAMSQEACENTKLLVGPWHHGGIGSPEPFGDIGFGPHAAVNIPDLHVRWYDARLKGIDTGVDEEPPLKIFVMGDNVWRYENDWPLGRTKFTEFYLHGGGHANTMSGDGSLSRQPPAGDEPVDKFTYDPEDPVPTHGGQTVWEQCGPWDRRPIEHRNDVLVYTSEPLESDLEVTGPLIVTLYASSSAPDTDFGGTLVDVHPDGKAIIIAEGMLRARFRESWDPPVNPKRMKPGEVYAFPIDLWHTSNVFKAGHRIRLEISSSNFPRFDRNLNTGHQPGMDTEKQIAKQTIYHDAERPSHILLPVIPR